MVISMTPYRLSLFGGGTDYPAWYRENGGAVLSTSINKYCYITCRYLPPFFSHKHRFVYSKVENVANISEIKHPSIKAVLESMNWEKGGLEVHHDGDLPARSGLGSSSSFTVGLINALTSLQDHQLSKRELANKAIYVEQNIIKEAVGSQDQIASAYGGINKIEFERDDSYDVQPVILTPEKKRYLESHFMLFFTGISRYATEAKSQIKNMGSRKKELTRIRQTVDEALSIIDSSNSFAAELGELMHEAWKYKRSISDKVSNKTIDDIYQAAIESGAYGGKLMGAGAGGFMVFMVKPELQERVRERFKDLTYVPFEFENFGSKIALYQPNGLG
jgi:D-glycero-alpha-D-manno-heptose-7-phosphate kinase